MERTAEPAVLVRALAETARRVEAAGRGLAAAQLKASPASGGWSPNEILWHIRATADVYGEHIDRILNEDEPRWRHVSPRARMKKSRYDEMPFEESFAAFKRQRAELVALLGSESPLTLRERVWGMANHEEIHCAQMEGVAAALRQGR